MICRPFPVRLLIDGLRLFLLVLHVLDALAVFRKTLYGGGAGARPAKQQRKEVKDEADEVAEVALLQLVLVT